MKIFLLLFAVLFSGCAVGYAPGLKPTKIGRDGDKDTILEGVRRDADLDFAYISHEVSFTDRRDAFRTFIRESFGNELTEPEPSVDDYFFPPVRTELLLRLGTAGSMTVRRENTLSDIELEDFSSLYLGLEARTPFVAIALTQSGDLQFGVDGGLVLDTFLLPDDINIQGEILIANTYSRFDAEVGAGLGFRIRKTIGFEVRTALALVNPILNIAAGGLGDNENLPVFDGSGEIGLLWRPIPRFFIAIRGSVSRGIVAGSRKLVSNGVSLGLFYAF